MADPRGATKLGEMVGNELTFDYDSTILYDSTQANGSGSVGLAVTIIGNTQVALVAANDMVGGKLKQVYADKCVVQVDGPMTLPQGNAVTVTKSRGIVGALGPANVKGYIQSPADPGAAYDQPLATTHQKTRGRVIDSAVTTACVVIL